MAKFCKKCGAKLDETTGLCPECTSPKEEQVKPVEQANPTETKKDAEPVKKAPNPKPVDNNTTSNPPQATAEKTKKQIKSEKKASKKKAKKERKKEKRAKLSTKQKVSRFFIKLIAIILTLAVLVGVGTCTLVYFDKIDIPIIKDFLDKLGISKQEKNNDNLAHSLEELKKIDIGEETRQESQVLETIDASTSVHVTSETNITKQFRDKGFNNSVVYSAYSMNGTYTGDEEIDENSSECHPLYYATYISDDNYCWTIYSCNGEWSASPISYMYSGLTVTEIVISEKNYIMSYDSYTNCFYKLIPNSNEGIIKSVSVINSETLDELAEKEFNVS